MQTRLPWELLREESHYGDEGCEVFPSCLYCPLPRCLEEEPWAKQRFVKGRRAERMLELRREGKNLLEIAGICGVSRRTVQRALKAVGAQQSRHQRSKVKVRNDTAQMRGRGQGPNGGWRGCPVSVTP